MKQLACLLLCLLVIGCGDADEDSAQPDAAAPANEVGDAATGTDPDPDTFTSYHIGNSLTWDSQPNALAALANSRGHNHVVGYHIRCGSNLPQIAGDQETCIDPVERFGTWRDALANHHFDAITIQPHIRSTLEEDVAVICEMIDAAVAGPSNYESTTFYIYQAWPRIDGNGLNYSEHWQAQVEDADDTPMVFARPYFEHLLARVSNERPDARVELIPVGEVFAVMDAGLRNGSFSVAGYSSASDFYRDPQLLHMNALGRFVAACTVYAVLYNTDPTQLVVPEGYFDSHDQPDRDLDFDSELLIPEVAQALQAVVWEVVGAEDQ